MPEIRPLQGYAIVTEHGNIIGTTARHSEESAIAAYGAEEFAKHHGYGWVTCQKITITPGWGTTGITGLPAETAEGGTVGGGE